jgi:aminopeptidase N
VRTLKARQFPEDAGPLAHAVRPSRYIEINNFYTATVYEKGAELVRMLQTLLGRDGFRKGMDLYFERHDGQAATVEDFVACFAEVSGRDLTQFMTWYAQAGTPEVSCALKYDARTETAELTFTQTQAQTRAPSEARKKPLHIPIRLGLLDAKGREMELRLTTGERLTDGLIELKKRNEKFRFQGIETQPGVSLLRDFSAPVNLRMERSDAELAFLMAHDSDLFNRWQAAQDYAARVLTAAVAARAAKARAPTAFIDALGASLTDIRLAPGYVAELMRLPSENELALIIGKDVDPLAIHRARQALRKAVAARLYEPLIDTYRRMATPGPYSPAPEPAGRRALRNMALSYLTARGRPEDIALAAKHFKDSRNLTDETAALGLLAETDTPQRAAALERFYKRWKGDHLVIDSWFTVQATSPLPGTLAAIKRLTQHALFSIKNPNKVRALIGQLAVSNPVVFNRRDGKGYDFVADRVLELDAFNPQMAARMLSAFRGWRLLEPVRRAAAKRTLRRVAKSKPLSNDVFEIVSRMLE